LAAGCDLMMVSLNLQAAVEHRLHHLAAEVHELIGGRARKVTLFVPQLIAQTLVVVLSATPLALGTVEVIERLMSRRFEPRAFEDEKLSLRTEIRGVGDARVLEIIRRLRSDMPRIAAIGVASHRILDIADQGQRGRRGERINESRLWLRKHEHVAFVNPLPAADAGAIEA